MASRLRICDDRVGESIHVVHKGVQVLWRQATTLDVLIVEHCELQCIEVVAFDPALDQEAPRVYLDVACLTSKINGEEMKSACAALKDPYLRHHGDLNVDLIKKRALNSLISKHLTSRLDVETDKKSMNQLAVVLKPQLGDIVKNDSLEGAFSSTGSGCLDFIVAKPALLVPVKMDHISCLRASAVMHCLQDFHENTQIVSNQGGKAISYINTANAYAATFRIRIPPSNMSTAMQRWRRAINKIIHGILVKKVRAMLEEREQHRLLIPILLKSKGPKPKPKPKVMRRSGAAGFEFESNSSHLDSPTSGSPCSSRPSTAGSLDSPSRSMPGVLFRQMSHRRNLMMAEQLDDDAKSHLPAIGSMNRKQSQATSSRSLWASSIAASNSRLERQQSASSGQLFPTLSSPSASSHQQQQRQQQQQIFIQVH